MSDQRKEYSVIAVELVTGKYARGIMASSMTEKEAEDFVKMAVYRRGVEDEFFKAEHQPKDKSDE